MGHVRKRRDVKKSSAAEFIYPHNALKEKVAPYLGQEPDLEAAQKAIDDLSGEFLRRLPGDFRRIDRAFENLTNEPNSPSLQKELFDLVHDLRGIAGTFDYKLLTVIGNDLCHFIERNQFLTEQGVRTIDYHISMMKKVVTEKITGMGGERGRALINCLHNTIRKVQSAGNKEVKALMSGF